MKPEIPERSEPIIEWTRKRYTGPLSSEPLERAEIITDRDLDKSIEQLLCDVQETYQYWVLETNSPEVPKEMKKPVELILYAFVRSTSMNAVVARENKKTQEEMRILARNQQAINVLLAILTFFTFIPLLFKISHFVFEFMSTFH